jgi:hypothetical protein
MFGANRKNFGDFNRLEIETYFGILKLFGRTGHSFEEVESFS